MQLFGMFRKIRSSWLHQLRNRKSYHKEERRLETKDYQEHHHHASTSPLVEGLVAHVDAEVVDQLHVFLHDGDTLGVNRAQQRH
jgi:hypothetical protein